MNLYAYSKEPKTGWMAQYYRIDKMWGVKLYREEWLRNEIYDKHVYFYSQGVGPKVGKKVNINNKYGFLIEHCLICENEESPFWRQKYDELDRSLQNLNIIFEDDQCCNWGVDTNGVPVVIDVGLCPNDWSIC